jgi:sugar phosphate permease
MVCAAAGLMLFTGVHPGGSYFTLVLPGAILSGLGMGLGLVSSTIAATQGVPAEQSGLASGLLNMSRLFGGALGLAILSTLAASETRASLSAGSAQALTDGFGLAFRVGALLCVAGAVLALFQLRAAPKPDVVESPSEGELEESEPLAA